MENQNNSETANVQPSTTAIICPHCNTSFDLQDVEEVDCSDCNVTTLTVLTKRCKDAECANAYCKDCEESNLNEHGFCSECELLDCDGCGDEIMRGTEIACTKCKESDFCETCAPEMVDVEIGCVDCVSAELKMDCADSNCSKTILKAKARKCKNFDSCTTAFCIDHAADDLDEQGLCEDCINFECSSCGGSYGIGEATRCANYSCKTKEIFCQKCSTARLNAAKLCRYCSPQPSVKSPVSQQKKPNLLMRILKGQF